MKSGLDESILAEIAYNSNTDIEDVRSTYHLIISNLREKSRIHDFIPLLAMNCVREHFRTTPKQTLNTQVSVTCIDIGREKVGNFQYFDGRYAR